MHVLTMAPRSWVQVLTTARSSCMQVLTTVRPSRSPQAVEGIADAWEGDLERRPRMRDALRPGLEDVLLPDTPSVPAPGTSSSSSNLLDAAGAFLRGLLANGAPEVPPAAAGSPLFKSYEA